MKPNDNTARPRPDPGSQALNAEDRRLHDREPATERVSLFYFNPVAVVMSGVLVDRSESGFRVAHQRVDLTAGQQVRFSWGRVCGAARVVWTRRTGDCLESGLAIVKMGAGADQRALG